LRYHCRKAMAGNKKGAQPEGARRFLNPSDQAIT
jgi:hypothetical protein